MSERAWWRIDVTLSQRSRACEQVWTYKEKSDFVQLPCQSRSTTEVFLSTSNTWEQPTAVMPKCPHHCPPPHFEHYHVWLTPRGANSHLSRFSSWWAFFFFFLARGYISSRHAGCRKCAMTSVRRSAPIGWGGFPHLLLSGCSCASCGGGDWLRGIGLRSRREGVPRRCCCVFHQPATAHSSLNTYGDGVGVGCGTFFFSGFSVARLKGFKCNQALYFFFFWFRLQDLRICLCLVPRFQGINMQQFGLKVENDCDSVISHYHGNTMDRLLLSPVILSGQTGHLMLCEHYRMLT